MHVLPTHCRDMREHFSDGSIDVVIDKGTMDALMCGDHALVNSVALLGEVHRCARCQGMLLAVHIGCLVWLFQSIRVLC